MKEIEANTQLIAACGLYCGACRSYLNGKCPGCAKNEKATWCAVRKCCAEKTIKHCDACDVADTRDCPKMNNFISRMFGLVFNSNRHACVQLIRKVGDEGFALHMAQLKRQSLPRNTPKD